MSLVPILLAIGTAVPAQDTLLSRSTARYEAYAPTAADLEAVAAGLEQAVVGFDRHVGGDPPRVAFVLYENAEQRNAYAADRLGLPTYSYPSGRRSTSDVGMAPWGELGVVLGDGPASSLHVLARYPGGGEYPAELLRGDILLRVNGEPAGPLQSLLRDRREWATGREVLLELQRNGELISLRFAFPGAVIARAPDGPWAEATETLGNLVGGTASPSFVAHEATHTMLGGRFGPLPSWFQEGVAQLVESGKDPVDAVRDAAMAGEPIPWRTLFSMKHPASAHQAAGGAPTNAVSVSGAASRFYTDALAAVGYVAVVGGDRALQRLAEWLALGRDAGEFPLPLDGLEASLGEHEGRWRTWPGEG